MMPLGAGILFGTGLFLVWNAFWWQPAAERKPSNFALKTQDILTQAGLTGVSFRQVVIVAAGTSIFCGLLTFFLVPVPALILVVTVTAAYMPWLAIRGRARRQQKALTKTWPEVIEHLSSGVRAGLSLPEAIAQLATRGPEPLRPPFREFAADYRVSGNFSGSLDRLKIRVADPVADRVIEALRLAHDVGGSDLTRLLRNLTQFLHDDLRTRGEIAARQSWTIAGSRLAVAAPWAILIVLSTRAETAQAYATPLGSTLILAGAGISVVAYRVMVHVGRLPTEGRVLR